MSTVNNGGRLGVAVPLLRLILAGTTLFFAGTVSGAADDLVWPLPPDAPRIRYVKSYSGAADFRKKPSRWRRVLVGPEIDKGIALKKPYGVTTDDAGRMYVTDTGLGAVLVFDESKKKVRVLGQEGQVRLVTPIGLAVADDGAVFVSDADLNQVFRFSADGRIDLALGRAEGLQNPTGIALDRNRNRLYVADSHLHKLFIYSTTGEFIDSWGERGPGPGQFNYPTNLAVDRQGNVQVVDTGNFRVQSFSPDGRLLSTFGEAGDAFGSFSRPKGIAVDSEGHTYVVDAAFNNYQIFDEEGRLLLFVGSLGSGPGRFWLPAGIHIDGKDRVFVVDQLNRRVQVFQYLSEDRD